MKLTVAGSGSASKEDVQKALTDYVGVNTYRTLDESDAVAVGVAYLLQTKLGRSLHPPTVGTTYMPPLARSKEPVTTKKAKSANKPES